MIEYQKLDAVKSEADKTNREFLYCVHTPDGVYIFNISKLCSENYNFNWENKSLPNKSKIGSNTRWLPKKVGYIDVNDSEFNISM
jgi:predicted aldo/keto reductase-like oxidoreductase